MAGAAAPDTRALPPRPQPDRRPSVRAAAGPAARGAGLGRCAAALRAARDPAAASRPAPHRSDGAGAHDADDPPLRHQHLGPGDRRGHAAPRASSRKRRCGDLKTVDDLLWSLKIPDHPQSRQRLLAPAARACCSGCASAWSWSPCRCREQQAVLNELMTIHTEALRPGHARPSRRAHARGDRAEHARRGRCRKRRRAASAIR